MNEIRCRFFAYQRDVLQVVRFFFLLLPQLQRKFCKTSIWMQPMIHTKVNRRKTSSFFPLLKSLEQNKCQNNGYCCVNVHRSYTANAHRLYTNTRLHTHKTTHSKHKIIWTCDGCVQWPFLMLDAQSKHCIDKIT